MRWWLFAVLLLALGGGLWLLREPPADSESAGPVGSHRAEDVPPPLLEGRPGEAPPVRPPDAAEVAESGDPVAEGPAPARVPGVERVGEPLGEGVIAGRVTDLEGQALVGATVRLQAYHVREADRTVEVRTDADGEFRFEDVAAGRWQMRVTHPGHASVVDWVQPGGAALRVATVPEARIEGVVVEAEGGRPVADVVVGVFPPPGLLLAEGGRARTDEDGAFSIGGLLPGPYRVEAAPWSGQGTESWCAYAPARIAAVETGGPPLEIRLERGLEISGVILDAMGDPYGGIVRVRVAALTERGGIDYSRGRHLVARGGAFRVRSLPEGDCRLTFTPQDDDVHAVVVLARVAAGTEGLRIQLVEGQTIRGRLVDDTGAPVTTTGWLHLQPSGAWPTAEARMQARLLGDGHFASPPLDVATAYDLRAVGFAGHADVWRVGLYAGPEAVEVVLPRALAIRGRVLDADGRLVGAGVPVFATIGRASPEERAQGGVYAFESTGPDGTFACEGLRPGLFLVGAGGGGSPWVGARVSTRSGSEGLELRVRMGVPFSGRLVDPRGEPVASGYVEVRSTGSGATLSHWTSTDPEGRFAFAGVPDGEVRLVVRPGDERLDVGTFRAPAADLEVVVPD